MWGYENLGIEPDGFTLDKPNLILSLSYLGDNNSKIFKFAFFKI